MFCTKCGIQLEDQDKFCNECGHSTGKGAPPPKPEQPLARPMKDAKIAGVCAGFARYFNVDVALVRVIWLVICVWPVPVFGVVAYIVAWIVMPKEPIAAVAPQLPAADPAAPRTLLS